MLVCRAVALAILVFLGADLQAVAADKSVLAPIRTFVRAANSGDRTMLISAFTSDSVIVDEFAPFRFPAPQAAAHWYDGFGADQAANGVSGARIAYTTPKFATISGTHAYVVLPTVYTYLLRGKPAKESGSLAFALLQSRTHWKISAMAWAKLVDTSVP